jgi:hypothetical protein
MGSVSLVVGHRQEFGLRSLLYWLAQERKRVRTHGSVSRCAVNYVGSPFYQDQWDLSKPVGISQKVAICRPCEICMVLEHTWTERGKHVACWTGSPLQGVHQFESPRLSDMSNRLFVAVIK